MRNIPESLETHLQTGTTTLCNCWKITRSDGTVQGFTDHDDVIVTGGVIYQAESGFTGTQSLSRIGLSVDNMEVHSAISNAALREDDLANGLYDNAKIELYLVNWQAPEDHTIIKSGNIGEVRRGALSFMAEVRGLAHHLQQPQGRLFQSTCDAQVGDSRCMINLDNQTYMALATVSEINADQTIKTDDLAIYSSNWFRGGKLTWLSGANTGAIVEVKNHQISTDGPASINLWHTLAKNPELGDEFNITVGCNKALKTCQQKFNNQINFRGFPHIPGNDFLISTPNQTDGAQDGSSQN